MAIHMSIRLAWHSDGWNGHICKRPCENSYCIGQHSYPGDLIASTRDLEFEAAHAGESCSALPCKAACGLSVNAFGKDTITVRVDPPSFWKKNDADAINITLPPSTVCTWCYEAMYNDEVEARGATAQKYDYAKRKEGAENYFAQFEPGKSLIFYYAGYSNPFSENEEDNYVIVGVSRVSKIGGRDSQDINTIIIDECSMIDLNLMATLFRAINWNSIQRLILIGDPNQLSPIGRGRVFADTIEWLNAEYPQNVGTLTDNIRQLVNRVEGNGNGILNLAEIFIQEHQQLNDGNESARLKAEKESLFEQILESGNGDVDKDLGVYFWNEQEELESVLTNVMVRDMQQHTGMDVTATGMTFDKLWQQMIRDENGDSNPEIVQVISPYRGEFYGTGSLNLVMQKTFNAFWSKKQLDGIGYYDKVIQFRNRPQSDPAYAYVNASRNNTKAEIFNGEIGLTIIHGLDRYAPPGKQPKYKWQGNIDRFQVVFSGESRRGLRYNYGKKLGQDKDGKWIPEQKVLDNLELAYAISVHKSQGSEFDYVYIVVPHKESHLLSMELLYTAITRAQKKVTIFLQQDISTLTTLSRAEKSAVRKINSKTV